MTNGTHDHHKVKLRVRFSLDNLKLDDDMLNIPLFMADRTDRLIGLALKQRKSSDGITADK